MAASLDDGAFRRTIAHGQQTILVVIRSAPGRSCGRSGGRPWVPVPGARFNTLHSRRLAGPEASMVDPVYTPINYEHFWVNDEK